MTYRVCIYRGSRMLGAHESTDFRAAWEAAVTTVKRYASYSGQRHHERQYLGPKGRVMFCQGDFRCSPERMVRPRVGLPVSAANGR